MFSRSTSHPIFQVGILALSCAMAQGCNNDLALDESLVEEVVPDDTHPIDGEGDGCAVHQISDEESASTVTKGTHDPNGPPMVTASPLAFLSNSSMPGMILAMKLCASINASTKSKNLSLTKSIDMATFSAMKSLNLPMIDPT